MTEIETIKEANCAKRIIDMGKIDLEYIRALPRGWGLLDLASMASPAAGFHRCTPGKIVGVRRVVAELLGLQIEGKSDNQVRK